MIERTEERLGLHPERLTAARPTPDAPPAPASRVAAAFDRLY
jgi:hypothetical protein